MFLVLTKTFPGRNCLHFRLLNHIVFKNPEHDELLYPDTMHSIQHLLSAASKEADLPNIIKIMPCGSRIAMEVAVLDAQSDFANH